MGLKWSGSINCELWEPRSGSKQFGMSLWYLFLGIMDWGDAGLNVVSEMPLGYVTKAQIRAKNNAAALYIEYYYLQHYSQILDATKER